MGKAGQRLFTPPVFAQNEKNQAVKLIYPILWIQIVSIAVIAIVLSLMVPAFIRHWLVFAFFTIVIGLALLQLARSGQTFLSSLLLVAELWALLAFFAWTTAGIGARAAWGYFIVVFIAGMLLGRTAGMIMAGICSLSTLAIAFLSPVVSPHPLQFWLTNTMYLVFVILLQFLASRSIRELLVKTGSESRERLLAQAALYESERKHREMVNSLPFCVFETDLQGNLTFVNQTALDWFGYSKDELLAGLNIMQIVAAADVQRVKENIERIFAGEEVTYHEYQVGRKDGSQFTALIRSRCIFENGIPVGLQGNLIDISDRKQAEEALLASNQFILSLLRAIPVAVFFKDKDGKYTGCNDAFTEIMGVTSDEINGKTVHEIWPSELAETYHRKDLELIKECKHQVYEYQIKDKHGQLRPVIFAKDVFLDANGKIGGMVGAFLDITERKKAEKDRELVISLLRATVESTNDGILVIDLAGKIMHYNQRFAQLWRIPDEILASGEDAQAVAFVCNQLIDPQNFVDRVQKLYTDLLAESFDLLEFKDGRYFERYSRPQLLGDKPVGRVWSFRDITERKRAEKEILTWKQRFENVTVASNQIVYDYDFATGDIQWSGSIEKVLGYQLSDMNGGLTRWEDLIAPQDRDEAVRLLDISVKNGIPYQVEYGFRHKNGHYVKMLDRGFVMNDNAGQSERMIGMMQDITERKRAEMALQESERRYRTLFESAGDAIFLLQESRIIDCNSRTLEVFGCSREQIVGLPISRFHPLLQPDGSDSLLKGKEKNTAALGGESQFFQWRHIRFDGTLFDAEVNLNRVELSSGMHVLAIVRDITNHKILEEQLRQAQKMEAVGILAGGVAHDFNNILSTIVGYASLLQMHVGPEVKLKEYLERILASTERAASLTHSLLAFSRKQAIELQPVDINESIFGFHKVLARLIGEDIDFTLHLASESLVVNADIRQIEQVLMNLATNARDAMPHGGKLTISSRSVVLSTDHGEIPGGSYAVITVFDSGTGIDKNIQGHLFEPFFTTKEVGKGTGLGLAIVYGIIKNHLGFIKLESEPAQGTTFHIYLPLNPLAIAKDRHRQQPRISRGYETILLVEDDAAVRHVTRSLLEEFGYMVLEAADGQEALAVFAKHRDQVHLLLSDLIMPKKNGKETSAEIMKLNPNIKTIFMSGYTSDIIARKGILEPGTHLLVKPLHPAALLEKIREVLDS